jgi:hypothetical protein
VVQNICNKIIMCGSCTEKNYNKIEETCKKKVHKVHNSISLGGKCCLAKYETGKLYNYCCLPIWRNAKIWKLSRELCGLLFLRAVNKSNYGMVFTQMMMTIDVN